MSDVKASVGPTGRVSPSAPEPKSLSAAVWSWLEHVPGLSARITKAEADMKAGSGTDALHRAKLGLAQPMCLVSTVIYTEHVAPPLPVL